LYVGLVAPHHPLVAPQEFFDLYPLDQLPPDKLHPRDGYVQHPWISKQAGAMIGEDGWQDEQERLTAIAAYYGLTSWMDHNVGRIIEALKATGQYDDTTIIYSSDHGENLGVRGLWGKMNMYEESAAIPLIVAQAPSSAIDQMPICQTTTSLLDVSETIIDHFEAELKGDRPGRSLYDIAGKDDDMERAVFSEYHAVGAVSGAFMLRKGRWKLIEYVGFDPELFDLHADPQELTNLANRQDHAEVLVRLKADMRLICDPETVNITAFADQEAMIEGYGGKAIAATMGAPSATPPPKT
jgi:choline-sulfatase